MIAQDYHVARKDDKKVQFEFIPFFVIFIWYKIINKLLYDLS